LIIFELVTFLKTPSPSVAIIALRALCVRPESTIIKAKTLELK
jgi:hypothetical protein